MIKIIYSIIFGAIQGLTEFLPVSSSGHLLILHELFNLQVDSLIFDVALHLGTLLALVLFFRRQIYILSKDFFNAIKTGTRNQNSNLVVAIIVATIPAGLIGFLFEDIIDFYLRNLRVVVFTLIIVGFVLIFVDKYSIKQRDFKQMKMWEIFLIGIAQAFALIPGVSRSGATIIAGLGLKLQRKAAAEISFLLSIPIIFGAGVKKILDLNIEKLSFLDQWVFVVGALTSFAVGYLVIKYFIKFLQSHSLSVFGWYRIILGVVMLIWLYLI